MMPSSGPATALAVDKLAGNITKPVNISLTYTNSFAIAANNLERYTK
jgi:NitT/TauT family transport system substrate-binding protein